MKITCIYLHSGFIKIWNFVRKIHMDEVLHDTEIIMQYKTKSPIINSQSLFCLNDFTKTPLSCRCASPFGDPAPQSQMFPHWSNMGKNLFIPLSPLSWATCARAGFSGTCSSCRFVWQPLMVTLTPHINISCFPPDFSYKLDRDHESFQPTTRTTSFFPLNLPVSWDLPT